MSTKLGNDQRRARLVTRHHLHAPAGDPVAVAESLVALHATDPATVHLSVLARSEAGTADVERALYDDRSLVRMLGMRRTMFVVPAALVPVVQAACADDIAVKQRKLLLQHLATAELDGDLSEWLAEVEEGAYAALKAREPAFAQQIADGEPRLRTEIVMAAGKPYEARGYITNRVLFLLAASGRIVRGRPRGTWLSTQYAWSTTETWLPGLEPVDAGTARVELARRWLRAFGPAPVADLKWWTGWTAGQVKKALTAIGPAEVDLEGGPGIALPGDDEPVPEPEPVAALLPALDPTPMGWQERGWFLGEHQPLLFDRTGNIGPTVWWEGRVVGGWGQRPDGEIAIRLLEDVGADGTAAVEAAAERLHGRLGGVAVIPKFRTPVERDLSS
ncbi:winged helix DNA-binding domain-containing protein [Amycolatopsis tucumanensis]|uniref:Winged helix DNA-binding domain-containing protein n=1 Tax=Amycolatopsis tucumanensis TaxID=401106 RepID=A0ABP7JDM2_9PSEU|nr:winged helix DNA-binding domain-containing protein [Amycolatopsis tucumanensis]MCF6427121.1 winged helix DNA-binding domain-containing protein [Amycolatopsis tucumanensis]